MPASCGSWSRRPPQETSRRASLPGTVRRRNGSGRDDDFSESPSSSDHDGRHRVRRGDHAEDIVMFDVPPPEYGVRGIEAYRDTWPPNFRVAAAGRVFDLVSLDVTAEEDVAVARPCSAPGDQRRDLVGGLDGGSRGQGPGEGALLAQVGASGAAAADSGL